MRLADRLRGRTVGSGPAGVATLVVLLALLIGILVVQTRRDPIRVSLLGDRRVTERQLATMAGALTKAQLADFQIRDGQVWVPADSSSAYLATLVDANALPPDFHSHTGDVLGENRWFESEHDSVRRLGHARERDLAASIKRMQGIADAMVLYGETETNDFRKRRIITASVTVLTRPEHRLTQQQVRTMRTAVAAARGMDSENVCVADLRTGRCYAGAQSDENSLAVAEQYLNLKQMLEREWHEKIRRLLRFIPGVDVVVHMELPKAWRAQSTETTRTTSFSPERIVVAVQVPHRFYESQLIRRPGDASDSPVPNASLPSESEAGSDGNSTPQETLAAEARRASIDGQIRATVQTLFADYPQMRSMVQIVAVRDDPSTEQVAAKRPFWRTAWNEHRLAWSVVLVSGVVVALLPLARRHSTRRLERQQPMAAAPDTVAVAGSTMGDEEVTTTEADLPDDRLRGTLTDLIREDPDRAAELLNRWLDRAG